MKKRTRITCLILIYLLSQTCLAQGTGKITATIDVYSGRSPVTWDMTPSEVSELKAQLEKLPPVQPKKIPTTDYVLVKNTGDTTFPYTQVYIFTKGIVIADSGNAQKFYLDNGDLMKWMLETGNTHDPSYTPPKYKTLPQGTPYIALTPTSFKETITQGTALKLKLTIFSEGNAPLQGTIETPDYVTADEKTINLKEIEGIKDYTFSIDTSQIREINATIIIRTNDPANKEIDVPIKITVLGKTAETSTQEMQDIENYLIYFAMLVAVALAALFIYWKKKTSN